MLSGADEGMLTSPSEGEESHPDKTLLKSMNIIKMKADFFKDSPPDFQRIKCVGVHGSISGKGCAPFSMLFSIHAML